MTKFYTVGIFGGGGGVTFDGNEVGTPVPSYYGVLEDQQEIVMLGFNQSYIVESIWLWERSRDYASPQPAHQLWHQGGTGGSWNQFSLDPNEYIVAARGRYGTYLDSIEFITTSKTIHIGGFGGQVDYTANLNPSGEVANPNWELCGFYGRRMTYIDAIGFYFRDRTMLPTVASSNIGV
jgi:hypothetical protein